MDLEETVERIRRASEEYARKHADCQTHCSTWCPILYGETRAEFEARVASYPPPGRAHLGADCTDECRDRHWS